MSTHTTVTCDLCKKTWDDGKMQMWYVGIYRASSNVQVNHCDEKYKLHICRDCTEDMRLLPVQYARDIKANPLPNPEPTIENILRTIVEEVLNERT